MKLRSVRGFLWVGWLALAAAVPLACGSDDGKKAAYDEGGAGGEAGGKPVNAAGSKSQPMPSAGEGGVPGGGGVPSVPNAGEAGTPSEQPTGGSGGAPSEPMGGTAGEGGATSIPVLPQCQGPTLSFKDPFIEQVVMDAVGVEVGPLTPADVAGLTDLTIPFPDTDFDLTGLECLSALQHLDCSGGAVGAPLDVLALLPNLESIDYQHSYIDDLTPFAVLTNVKSLDFGDNFIQDLTPLADLTQLESLGLAGIGGFGGGSLDIGPLASLTNLRALDLSSDKVTDGTALASLAQLQELSLRQTQLASYAVVSNLTQLQMLDLSESDITTLPDLSKLTKLTSLNIAYDTPASFAPLSKLTKLTSLNAASTGLADLSVIASLIKLDTLDVSYNTFTDATVLGALPLLSTLDISYDSAITSLEPLVQSQYIGTGDYITALALDCDTHGTRITALIAKGAVVGNSCGL
ncbi:MAG TPA: leucine-rich repeat domain-containing protein [Polyangiaceae bacterium]|nr:leucine-rich repeat domain-containing protein [Polyangiaceae bacterium]